MYSVLYIDVVKGSARSGSFLLLYYLLNFSGNYMTAREEEKQYKEIFVDTKEELLREIAGIVNAIDSDDGDTYTFTSSDIETVSTYLAEAQPLYYTNRKLTVLSFPVELGYLPTYSLYDIYRAKFGVTPPVTTVGMVDMLVNFAVTSELSKIYSFDKNLMVLYCRCVCDSLYYISFCWCTVSNLHHRVTMQGSLGNYVDLSKPTRVYDCNLLITQLYTALAESGIPLETLVWVGFNPSEYGMFNRIVKLCDCKPMRDLKVHYFIDILKDVRLFSLLTHLQTYSGIMGLLREEQEWVYSAQEIASVIAEYSEAWKAEIVDSKLCITNRDYLLDFSGKAEDRQNKYREKPFVILDCEGTVSSGATEIGGVVAVRNGNTLIKLGDFSFERSEFAQAFSLFLKTWQNTTGRKVEQGVTIYTYGNNDKAMFMEALRGEMGRHNKRKYLNYLHFEDCQPSIFVALDKLKLNEGRKLSEVAVQLGVSVVLPKHNALNDARTLFNILYVLTLLGKNEQGKQGKKG